MARMGVTRSGLIVPAAVASTSENFLEGKITGEAQPRIRISGSGRISWGGGTTAVDSAIFRNAAGQLKTDNEFHFNANVRTGTGTMAGGSGVIAVGNAVTVPNSNPTGGGVLYAEGGSLKWRGSNGTVTTIAPA